MEEKIEVNDYEMEPNSNGQGMVLHEYGVLKDGLITFNSITLAATLILLIIFISMAINEQGSAGSSDEAGTVLFILIGCIIANMMTPEQQWCFKRKNVRKMGHSQEFVFIVQSGI